MNYIKVISALFLVAVLSSCSIKHEIHFNKDWSGTFNYSLESTDGMDFSGLDSTLGGGGQDAAYDSIIDALSVVPGLSDVQIEQDSTDNSLNFSVKFDNLDVLNDVMKVVSMGDEKEEVEDAPKVFTLKGNKLYYNMNGGDTSMGSDEETADMEGMMSMMKFELKMTFDKEVKKVKSKNSASKTSNNKGVEWKTDFSQIVKGEESTEIVIYLKK